MGSEVAANAAAALQVVLTDDGPITLTSLENLEQLHGSMQMQMQKLSQEIQGVANQAGLAQARAGWALTRRAIDWSAGPRMPDIVAAKDLETSMQTLSDAAAEIMATPHHGIGGLIGSVRDKHKGAEIEAKIQSTKAELDSRYKSVADHLESPTGVVEADALLDQMNQQLAQARELSTKSQQLASEMQRLSEEVQKRKKVSASLGFDALGVQADLIANGPKSISTDLVMKPTEIALASRAATLCRHKTRTQYVGGSQGLSIPLGHGFRYRVSSFRGHPVQSDVLAQLDQGTLVVTNQRLVFLGNKREVSTPVGKLIQIEPFSDAIGIAREGKESRDIYLVDR